MNAKVAGALLACSLALREPFQSQSISIVGFSLGNQVTKTCLKTLAELGANDVIQNVTFLGAAIARPDRAKTRQKMASVFSQTINGELKQVYTKNDWILATFYTVSELELAMGRHDCFEEQFIDDRRTNLLGEHERFGFLNAIANPNEDVFRITNYDIYSLNSSWFMTGIGHRSYRSNLALILQHINFNH